MKTLKEVFYLIRKDPQPGFKAQLPTFTLLFSSSLPLRFFT